MDLQSIFSHYQSGGERSYQLLHTGEVQGINFPALGLYAQSVSKFLRRPEHRDHMLQYTKNKIIKQIQDGFAVMAINNETGRLDGYCKVQDYGPIGPNGTHIYEVGTLISMREREGIGSGLILSIAESAPLIDPTGQFVLIVDQENEKPNKLFGVDFQLPLIQLEENAANVMLGPEWINRSNVYDMAPLISSVAHVKNNGNPNI